jgi:hypothetical protein
MPFNFMFFSSENNCEGVLRGQGDTQEALQRGAPLLLFFIVRRTIEPYRLEIN